MPRVQPAAFALGGALVTLALAAVACSHSHDRTSGSTPDATDEPAPTPPVDAALGGNGDGGDGAPDQGDDQDDATAVPDDAGDATALRDDGASDAPGPTPDGAADATVVDAGGCGLAACGDIHCGDVRDRCGDTVDCGHCASTFACWSGACVPLASLVDAGCKPWSCDSLGLGCGLIDDGCGNLLDCGHCTAPDVCGGADGHHCGPLPVGPDGGAACAPVICGEQPPQGCGLTPQGCGYAISCGVPGCVGFGPTATCGGTGQRFSCGTGGTCVPLTCAPFGYDCGQVADGCGGLASCGSCPDGGTCGAGGFNRCGPAAP